MFLRLILLGLIAFFASGALSASQIGPETGSFFLREYSPKMYRATPQNWSVVENKRGIIYVGNNDGVLEYDGQSWRKYTLPNGGLVRSLAVAEDGTIYVGGQSEIGFLKPDETGTLQYVSLLEQVAPPDRVFTDVWTTTVTPTGVLFSSNQRLLRWSPTRGMKAWKSFSDFSSAFTVDGLAYVLEKGSGLYRLMDDTLQPVPGGQMFAHASLRGVFRFMGSVMVATPEALYVQEGSKFEEFETEAKTLLHDSRIVRCLPMQDGILAVGTIHNGAVLLGAQGNILRILNSGSTGLHGDSVNSMFGDREGGLWLALNSGLARMDIASNISRFGEPEGLGEIVPSIERQSGRLYAGTMGGLAVMTPDEHRPPKFESVTGIHGQVMSLASSQHGLLVGVPGGLYEVTQNRVRELCGQGAIRKVIVSVFDPSTAYAVGNEGLFVLRLSGGQWQQILHLQAGGDQLLSVAEEQSHQIWTTTVSDLWRFDLRSNPAGVQRFHKEQGVPSGLKYVSRVQGRILFATRQGLFRFDPALRTFAPDKTFGLEFSSHPRPVETIVDGSGGEIWISGQDYHGVLRPGRSGRFTWTENVLGNAGIRELYGLHLDPEGTVWASGVDGGLIRYTPGSGAREDHQFTALLREVQIVGHDRAIFGGAAGLSKVPELQHRENAVIFRFAAPSFQGVSETEFRSLLEGLDRKWSPWTSQAEKEYTNLWEGKYRLRVQARNTKGQLSRESSLAFRVLAPWYRRPWAYCLYAVVAISFSWLFSKWRLLALAEQNRKLEAIIEERTQQVRQQRDEIKAQERETESLLLNILPASVAQELRTTGKVTPLTRDDVTVCFTDFVGFTLSSETLSAVELVEALGRYFTEFDRIVDHFGLEKVKTIGDSYMFVSGLTKPKTSHATDAVMAALEMVEVVERFSHIRPGWKIRVGIHSGPAIAGVVGCRKFAFDVWGKTVNFASRHESCGRPNSVNISAQTYELIREQFHCEARGPILIKEGRYLDMYLVQGLRNESCDLSVAANV